MIKRITFATFAAAGGPGRGQDVAALEASWPVVVAAALDAPPGTRPRRVVACVALPDEIPDPAHDAIGIEWFADAGHLRRFESWLGRPGGPGTGTGSTPIEPIAAPDARGVAEAGGRRPAADPASGGEPVGAAITAVVVAEEHVLRGRDWLDQRWTTGGTRLKHMALARRAAGLTPAEFSERWQGRAGRVGAVPIPDVARGCAYVQNHPLPRPQGDWPYDAVNEVWFDDLDALRTRIRWMTEALSTGADDDFVGTSSFVAVREQVLS